MNRIVAVGALSLLVLLSGCAAEAVVKPSASPASATPTPSETPIVQTETLEPTEPPQATDGFSDDLLIQICLDKAADSFGAPLQADTGRATVEHYESDYPWFVVVPGTSGGVESLAYCTIGGTAAEPTFKLHGAADASMEDEVRSWVG